MIYSPESVSSYIYQTQLLIKVDYYSDDLQNDTRLYLSRPFIKYKKEMKKATDHLSRKKTHKYKLLLVSISKAKKSLFSLKFIQKKSRYFLDATFLTPPVDNVGRYIAVQIYIILAISMQKAEFAGKLFF